MNYRYGYLGPQGTHCEEALYLYLSGEETEAVPYPSIEQVISAVRDRQVTHGIVPLENSIEGTVNLTLDLMANDADMKIVGEVILPVRHNLLMRPGEPIGEITSIISHPQALAQCRSYLNRSFSGIPVREVNSTAEAARLVAESEGILAAIGSERAAGKYGLSIAEGNIQDCRENRTRFVIISREEAPVKGRTRTSVVISITDRPGGLYQILREFALANINLTRIESRPAKRNLGDYLFFIDLEGHREDPLVKSCLEAVEDMAASFRVLGSYPVWEELKTEESGRESAGLNVSLDELRQDIDIIDYQIVELLARRTQIVSVIGSLKNGNGGIRDSERERQVLARVRRNAIKKGVSPELMEKIYREFFDYFTRLQEEQQKEQN